MKTIVNKIKKYIVHKLIGNYYTEVEVYNFILKMQIEMARQILGNSGKDRIAPTEFLKSHGKYGKKWVKYI